MEHIARSFSVSLSVTHPDIDPAIVSQALGLTPAQATRAGASRTTPRGDPLEGTYSFTCWRHQFEVDGARELAPVLQDLVERLQPHAEFFSRVVREGGRIELFCGVLAGGNWDEVLPYELLGRLAALAVDLRLDVYPNDERAE